jgi:hypothetical protein
MMLKAAVMGTEDFLGWVSGGRPSAADDYLSPPALQKKLSGKLCAIVTTDDLSDSRPAVVVVDSRKSREFFAFVSTYIAEFTPFTAYFRVITTDDLELLMTEFGEFPSGPRQKLIERFVGVAIVEAALYTRARGTSDDGKSISLAAASATYSTAAIQGLRLGPMADVLSIGKGWQSLRSLVGGERLPLDLEGMVRFWNLVRLSLYGGSAGEMRTEDLNIAMAMRHAIDTGRVTDDVLEELLSLVPDINMRMLSFRGPREQRARAVQEVLSILTNLRDGETQTRECLAGCLLSVLGDGSFKFLPTALSLSSSLPMAPLWFALWSGVQQSSDLMTAFNCLGRRLARDLRSRKDIFSEPVDDISLVELQTASDDLERIPRGQGSSLSVEIYPNVSSRQGLSRTALASAVGKDFQKEFKELRSLLAQSTAVLSKIDGSYSSAVEPKEARTQEKPSSKSKFR